MNKIKSLKSIVFNKGFMLWFAVKNLCVYGNKYQVEPTSLDVSLLELPFVGRLMKHAAGWLRQLG